MSHWLIYWLSWGAMFLVAEGIALFNKTSGDTLSETVWNWLKGKREKTIVNRIYVDSNAMLPDSIEVTKKPITWNHNTYRTWVVGSFLLWLFFHLTFGWFAG